MEDIHLSTFLPENGCESRIDLGENVPGRGQQVKETLGVSHVPEIVRRLCGWYRVEGDGQTVGEEGDRPGCVGLCAMVKMSVHSASDGKSSERVQQGGE